MPVKSEKEITSIVIAEGETHIASAAFKHCPATSVTIPNSVTEIGDEAFSWCENLLSVCLPDSVRKIGSDVFAHCPNLTSISLGDGLEYIGADVFTDCHKLNEIKVTANNRSFLVEDGLLLSKDKETLYYAFPKKEIEVPTTVEYIESGAFSNCKDLKITLPTRLQCHSGIFCGCENCTFVISDVTQSLSFPKNAQNLTIEMYHAARLRSFKRDYKFRGVKKVVLPNSIKNISAFAFDGCSGLQEVVIPESVEYVEKFAFCGCTALGDLSFPKTVTSIDSGALAGVPHVEFFNLCHTEDVWLDLDGPFTFEATQGRLHIGKRTSNLVLHGTDTEKGHQRHELLKYWFGEMKPALVRHGFYSNYWNCTDNTFEVGINKNTNVIFETGVTPNAEDVAGFVKTLASNTGNAKLGFKIVDKIVTEQEKKAKKAKKKAGPFVLVVSDAEKLEEAKTERLYMMRELLFKGIMSNYLEQNPDVGITVCKADSSVVELGIDFHGCFLFMLTLPASDVENGTAVTAVQDLLCEMEQFHVRCRLGQKTENFL